MSKLSEEIEIGAPCQEFTRSRELIERARRSLALGVSSGFRARAQPLPIYIERGAGARFVDVDGNEFIDHCLAWGPLILGHAHPAINAAVARQLERGYTFGAQCELEFEVAEQIRAMVPCAERVLYLSTGSEAVQGALRLARAATGRRRIIKFEGHYHGWMDSVLVSYHPALADAGPSDAPVAVPGSGGQSAAAYSETVVLPWNDAAAVERYLDQHLGEVAAIITEPILCNSGCLMPQPGYLAALRTLADRHGVVLIFDEVITGFRVNPGGAQQLFGVTPDLAIFGKAVAGGFPLSVIAGRESVIGVVETGRAVHAGTFNGNPIVLAAARATLATLAASNGAALAAARQYGEGVMAQLERLASQEDIPLRVFGHGAVFKPAIGLAGEARTYRDIAAFDAEALTRLVVQLFYHGVYCVPDGRWYVSAAHGAAEQEYLREALPKAMRAFAREHHKQKG
jgi:glutamate-1-semialdehyde 2,1-aminomutase